MGRLENLLPQLKPGQFKQQGTTSIFTTNDGAASGPLTPDMTHFLEMCKGTYSVKEICAFAYDKRKKVNFTETYQALETFAKQDFFKNSKLILETLKSTNEPGKSFAVPKNLSKDELTIHLRKVGLFGNLPVETLKSIVDGSRQQVFKAGEIIIKRDTVGTDAYVLLNGSVGVYSMFYMMGKGEPLAVLPPLSVFGESAAVSNKKRTADVVALTDSLVLVVQLGKVVEPKGNTELSKSLRLRLVLNQLMRIHPVFKNLPSEVLQLLLASCQVENIPAHKTVLQQGDDGHQFYFILAGTVMVIKDRLPEVRLSVGSFFGEMGVLKRQTRTASIVTETNSTFLTLTEKNFIALLSSNLQLGIEIEKEISNRSTPVMPEVVIMDDREVTEEITQKFSEFDKFKDFDFSLTLDDPEKTGG